MSLLIARNFDDEIGRVHCFGGKFIPQKQNQGYAPVYMAPVVHVYLCRHYRNEAEVMLEENWRVRLEELSFELPERRGMTRTGSRVSLYRVSVPFSHQTQLSVN